MPAFDNMTVAPDERPQANALLPLEQGDAPEWIDDNGHMTEWQYLQGLCRCRRELPARDGLY